ncbi:alpha/beta fold hydrolase [Brevundimonas sp.]|uniref:alpha/beta fold hydrolase n=1 Tax=Brevundimonas sp. TaxID=1871086 RepID=UPI003D115113
MPGARSWLEVSVRAYLTDNEDVTIDDIAVATGPEAYLLLQGARNTTRLVKLTPGSTSEVICGRNPPAPRAPALAWQIENLEAAGRLIAANHFSSEAGSRGLVVYFHGGPSGSLRDRGYLATVRNYANMGYDVLAVDGLGSRDSGPRAMEDLRSRGLGAVWDDARAVAARVRQLSPGPRRIIIHGESFGAAQAIATGALLKPASLVLVVPWLNHRHPRDILVNAAQIRSQLSWETAVFGPRDAPSSVAFREGLSSLSRENPLGRSALVIFAEGDLVSRPEDIAGGDAEVMVLSGASHSLVMSSRSTWKHIADHIERPSGPDRH